MEPVFFRHWWALALRGLIALLFGVIALAWPRLTLDVLVIGFGLFALMSGSFALIAAVDNYGTHARRWALLLEALAGISIGAIAIFWPDITALTLLYLIAAWSITTGILECMVAVWMHRVIGNEWMLLSGIAALLFGVLLAIWPRMGLLALIWLTGIYALIVGVLLLILALLWRGLGRRLVLI